MGIPIEHHRAAIGVKRHFQHACFRTVQASIRESVAIGVKAGHDENSILFRICRWAAKACAQA
jgi:hypothetical protein